MRIALVVAVVAAALGLAACGSSSSSTSASGASGASGTSGEQGATSNISTTFAKPTAYSIICDIAGSNQERYNEINQAGILPNGDIKSCPAQYQEDVKSFTQVLQPHVNGNLNFQAPSN